MIGISNLQSDPPIVVARADGAEPELEAVGFTYTIRVTI
jgi:hypothetical protein